MLSTLRSQTRIWAAGPRLAARPAGAGKGAQLARGALQPLRRGMKLTPRELDHLVLHNAGFLAQKRLARGLRLNKPEAKALLATQMMEMIRDGKAVHELMLLGKELLGDLPIPCLPNARRGGSTQAPPPRAGVSVAGGRRAPPGPARGGGGPSRDPGGVRGGSRAAMRPRPLSPR
jgi:hypothetical protein